MKNLLLLLSVAGLFISIDLSAQEEASFKPNGKPEIRIFTSFSTTFSDGENQNKFDVTRAYLGYIYNFSPALTGRVTYDAGNPSSGKFHYTGYLKFAYLQYHKDKLTVNGGMFLTPQYEYVEKKWGYRYVSKSFSLENGFELAADMGISAAYNFTHRFSGDIIIMNGEGNKLTEADSALRAGIGMTFIPVKNLSLRGYFDSMKKRNINQQTLEFIASYENKRFNLSALYNFQKDHNLIPGQDYSGFSVNGSFLLKKNMKLYARFDKLTSEKVEDASNPWNFSKDGILYIAGIEFAPAPGIKFSPNFQCWQPADKNNTFISKFFLSTEIRF